MHANSEGLQQGEDFSEILTKLRSYLLEYYEPVFDPRHAEFHYSTREVWQQLQRLFPNEIVLTEDIVSLWLNAGGFTFHDYGELKLDWMMKKK